MLVTLNEDNDLVYQIENTIIPISSLYYNGMLYSKNIEKYPDLTYKTNYEDFLSKICYKEKHYFDLFSVSVKFELIDHNITGEFYSFFHVQKIKEKYHYSSPYFTSNLSQEYTPLGDPEKNISFKLASKVCIKEIVDDNTYSELFEKMEAIYNVKNEFIDIQVPLQYLSFNFKKYFSNEININLPPENKITIYNTKTRLNIYSNIRAFLNNNEKKIYALSGPSGIGKSISSLKLQKDLHQLGFKSFYVNLANEESISELKETLIIESYFLNLSQKDFLILAFKIKNSNSNNIWDIIFEVDNYCLDNGIEYLLILDQYQREKDKNKDILKLNVKKIFLLSSINDEDVKDNLVQQIKGTFDSEFKYEYFRTLEIDNYLKIDNEIKLLDKNIIKCIEYFNYLPDAIFLLKYIYNWNTLDLFNSQYRLILQKLSKFYKKFKIAYIADIKRLCKINNSKDLHPKFIDKTDIINNIKDIPLKYIAYDIFNKKNSFGLFYAFDYVKYPLENEINYHTALETMISKKEGKIKGSEFEYILLHKFILDKPLFKIDCFIQVDKIVNMELQNEYIYINTQNLKTKNNVFIWQSDSSGEDYDYCILSPIKKEIILFQAKYKITEENIKSKAYYSAQEKVSIITNIISKKFGISLEKIYLLYISTYEYNYKDRTKVFKMLNSKSINCLFYKLTEESFTYNFEDILYEYNVSESNQIYPINNKYDAQYFSKKKKLDNILFSIMKAEEKKNKYYEENEYENFIRYLQKKTNIKNDISQHLGKFIMSFSNNYRAIPKLFCNYYLLFFKLLNGKIDYTKDIILLYEANNKIFNYNITKDKFLKELEIKEEYNNYYYVIGEWDDKNEIDLNESF